MRKYFIAASVLCISSFCYAQSNIFEANGNVGIGIANPDVRLAVSIPVSTSFASGDPNAYGAYFTDNTSSTLAIRSLGNGTIHLSTDLANRQLVLGGGTFEQTMTLLTGGKVGVGTTSVPAEYKLAVAGKIIAEELKVKLQSSGWPDYVFKPQYRLMPLSQVENFIKEKGHLPEIPSAEEVAKEGVELGTNQALLLKKIEEMTLHLISINKRVESLEAENRLLKKQLEKAALK